MVPEVVTGKPIHLEGSEGREAATAQGLVYCINKAAKKLGMRMKEADVCIQGFGKVGWNAARLLHEQGCKVIAVSDSSGGIYNRKGIDPRKVYNYKNRTSSVLNYEGSKNITNAELLELESDILIPAAVENQITKENAGKINTRLLAEGANGPTTPEASKIISEKKIFILPDILANSGGVTVSYFEWVQNLHREHWSQKEVYEKLQYKIIKAFNDVFDTKNQYDTDMRTAALTLAVGRVANSLKTLGLWP